jgi:hypothetical protein
METGIELIAEERQRQIEVEGWTKEHDSGHRNNELIDAAMQYLGADLISCWPWGDESYKPSPDNRVRELQKAGALIAAEIDRLQNS